MTQAPDTQDFEKLGAFYLGREYNLAAHALGRESILYDARDLTTHAVIIGMTGSGKTGLGVSLIEEAALDQVPVIAIDPKGDLGNLMLTFPDLAPADFEPWVDARQAAGRGQSTADHARDQAALWKQGLADWGQDGERIRALRAAAEFGIYTPGSSAGIPVSVLSSFDAPDPALRADAEAFAERVQAAATSLLTLLGMDADPLTSRDHILISNILSHHWRTGRSLTLAQLITAIQTPPIERIGVMDLEAVYPAKARFELAMRLNNLLASPGFSAWLQGVPLSAESLLHTDTGKPRVSIISIAHLSDTERMFFVTMLLAEIIAWMRTQPGTGSLRALLYMDELFGYMPPTANPPSKALFLTLLKQARAFGLGLVLSTQNPVDLDYKGLSNTGTWFIGRLQTERDKNRVLDGLEGAAAGGGPFDKQAMEQVLAGLGKRVFLLHNVHENAPAVFHTRWALSYLPGPLTREQIRRLMAGAPKTRPDSAAAAAAAAPAVTSAMTPAMTAAAPAATLAPDITQYALAPATTAEVIYYPRVLGVADVRYASKTHGVDTRRQYRYMVEADDAPVPVNWDTAEPLAADLTQLRDAPASGAALAEPAAPARDPKQYKTWAADYRKWLRHERPITLLRSPTLKAVSRPEESEAQFRMRLRHLAREARDIDAGQLRTRYERRAGRLRERLQSAEAALDREAAQASQRKLDTAVSFGSALLGAFLGRKTFSATTARRLGTAARRAGAARKEAADVDRAEHKIEDLQQQMATLDNEFRTEIAALDNRLSAADEPLEQVAVKARSSDIDVRFVALLWLPHAADGQGRMTPAFSPSAPAVA